MRLPTIAATIERRLLVNYRVDPELLSRLLPRPFRPQLVSGFGLAGICLIRLGELRPAGLPRRLGLTTENAAHRIAVEWDSDDGRRSGVYIPRRDTSSRLTALVGGRLFPGVHQIAQFQVHEHDAQYRISLTSLDGETHVKVEATAATELPSGSVFQSLEEASSFFKQGALGWSATGKSCVYDGVELNAQGWRIEPARLETVESRFFDNPHRFPPGTAEPDSALVMRDLPSRWRARRQLIVTGSRIQDQTVSDAP
jgi:hypothetical protein